MFFKTVVAAGLVAVVAAAPQVTTAPSASTTPPFGYYSYNQSPSVNSASVASVASVAGIPASEIPGADVPVDPVVSSQVTGATSHGPFSGTPTTIGAVTTVALAKTIPMLPPNPTATVYNPNGLLNKPEPIPYQPGGHDGEILRFLWLTVL